MIQTGVRVSELCALRVGDLSLGSGAHCRVIGKGRKARCAMLTAETVTILRAWNRERKGHVEDPLFPPRCGGPLTPKAVAWRLDKHTTTAARRCQSLASKRVTPHVLRHYVDGSVMWPAGVFALLGLASGPVPAT